MPDGPASRGAVPPLLRGRLAALLRLRPTLVTTIVGLVCLTAAAVGVTSGVVMVGSARTMITEARDAAVQSVTHHAVDFFEVAPHNTEDLAREARRGLLPLDRPERLAAVFAERLRDRPELAWIGYGERAGGQYAGATRYESGEIVEYVADPAVNGGVAWQMAVSRDGALSTPKVVESQPYLVRTRDWFRDGLAVRGPAWTGFYTFFGPSGAGGGVGITCTSRYVAPGAAEPVGVFHADLRVGSIGAFLSSLRVGRRGAVFLTDRTGHRIVSPTGPVVAAAAQAVDAVAASYSTVVTNVPTRVRAAGGNYQVVYVPVQVAGNPGFGAAVVVDLDDITEGLYREAAVGGGIALVAILIATAIGVRLASMISLPVVAIAKDLATVGEFKITSQPSPRSFVREIAELGRAVDAMKASLRSFGRYVPTDLVRTLLAAGSEATLGGDVRRLSIFFSDVADFTSISEGLAPRPLVASMSRYFELMNTAIRQHHGTVNKFMGDGIMAFFNAPLDLPDHPREACLAALDAQAALALKAAENRDGDPAFRTRIGLGFGDVLVGNIGTPERFAYTLLGDEVNLASRLEELNKSYGTSIMASEELAAAAGDGFEWRRLDRVAVKGRHEGTLVCELLGERGRVAPEILAARDLYEAALAAYFAGDFARAAAGFDAAAAGRPTDSAGPMMAARSRTLAAAPPANWDGIHVMHEK